MTGSVSYGTAKVAAIAAAGAAAKGVRKKTHIDDDLFENESEDETIPQSPGMGALAAILAIGAVMTAARKRVQ